MQPLAPLAAQLSYTDPAAIVRLVEEFAGGARASLDARLRLHRCSQPLALAWYGQPGRSVAVSCPDANGWRIFVTVARGERPLAAAPSVPASPVIKRGESVTVAVQGRGFTVQRLGEAMSAGAVGEWITVRIGERGASLRARIERPGLAVIP